MDIRHKLAQKITDALVWSVEQGKTGGNMDNKELLDRINKAIEEAKILSDRLEETLALLDTLDAKSLDMELSNKTER